MQEQDLIIAAKKGDTGAFEALVSLFEAPIVRYLRFRIANEADVQEVFQETFINAYRYLNTYRDDFAFSTWLFSIANNQCKKLKSHTESLSDEIVDESSSNTNKIDHTNIWNIINRYLSHEQTQLLWFYYVEELSIKHIAIVLERSAIWVKVNLVRVRNKLQDLLKQHSDILDDYGLVAVNESGGV